MADKKISELTALTGASVADADLLPIVDISATETKSLSYAELKTIVATVDTVQTLTNKTLTSPTITTPNITWSTNSIVGIPTYNGLVCSQSAVTTIDVDATHVHLYDSTNFKTYKADSVNLTCNITSAGIDGLDTGSETNSTLYYVYVIWDGTTVSSLMSLSATSPTMPSGYTYKRLVSFCYNDSGGDLLDFNQRGAKVSLYSATLANTTGNNSFLISSFTGRVPANAETVDVRMDMTTNGAASYLELAPGNTPSAVPYVYSMSTVSATLINTFSEVPLEGDYLYVNFSQGSLTTALVGFRLDI